MKFPLDKSSSPAIVALGANLPFNNFKPEEILRKALHRLSAEGLTVAQVSRFWRTPAFPEGTGPDYVNAVASVTKVSDCDATSYLALLHEVEAEFGRERHSRWAGRTLDLDLIALGDSILPDAPTQDAWRLLAPERQRLDAPGRLILPHPRMQDRAFVLVPMAEIAPDWRHPRTGLSVTEMLDALPEADRAAVKPL